MLRPLPDSPSRSTGKSTSDAQHELRDTTKTYMSFESKDCLCEKSLEVVKFFDKDTEKSIISKFLSKSE